MWFKNLQLYRLPENWQENVQSLEEKLAAEPLPGCASGEMQSIGWVATPAGSLLHSVNHQWLLALGIEQKLLPSSVVRLYANERAKAIEEAENRRVGRKEMRELRETLVFELLPKAFINRRTTFAWIDPVNGWLAVDASAPAKAEELLSHLRKSTDNLPVRLLKTALSPSAAMTAWMAEGEAPSPFTLDQDLELRSAENARVRYVRHSLEGEEIRQHIADGKVATRLAMTWADKISFVLDENLQIKRLEFLDILKEEAETQAENEAERFDLDFTLMTGELSRLLKDLVQALGGELEDGQDTTTF